MAGTSVALSGACMCATSSSASRLHSASPFHTKGSSGRLLKSQKSKKNTCAVVCAAEGMEESSIHVSRRREACFGMATLLAAASTGLVVAKPEDASAREVEVGSYLPASTADPRFVQFKASTKDTPALRAGNVQPYDFVLPPTWKQERVANILSGNYCQPKCAEPWVEVKFADPKEGAIQVVAAPLVRLTNKPNATIEEIGSPEKILAALGSFVTGNSFDPDEVVGTSIQRRGGNTYYNYELETPFAKTGLHNLAAATAKGSVVMLFVVSASESQWNSSEKLLRSIVDSFQV